MKDRAPALDKLSPTWCCFVLHGEPRGPAWCRFAPCAECCFAALVLPREIKTFDEFCEVFGGFNDG
jgi:hypothetical protein